jgi:putative sterol carrier protein
LLFDPAGTPVEPETWVFEGSGTTVAVTVGDGALEVRPNADGLPREPSATFIADVSTMYDLFIGRLDASAALADGRLRVEGDEGALGRVRAAFPRPESSAVAA